MICAFYYALTAIFKFKCFMHRCVIHKDNGQGIWIVEVDILFTSFAQISELEALHAKAACLPIQLDEDKELSWKISVGKVLFILFCHKFI